MSNKRVDILTTAECRELLDRHHFGRLGFVDYVGVFPFIIPVNYLLDEDKILIRTDAGSKLNAAVRGAPVADEAKLAERRQTPLRGWHPGRKPRYVQINASQGRGRRIRIADIP